MLTIDDARTILRNERIRLTPQRLSIVEVLIRNYDHPTVERIQEILAGERSSISLATIYSTAILLARYGLISLLYGGKGGLRLDPDTTPHAHAYCIQCGWVLNVPINQQASVDDSAFRSFKQAKIETSVFGYCPKCAELLNEESLA